MGQKIDTRMSTEMRTQSLEAKFVCAMGRSAIDGVHDTEIDPDPVGPERTSCYYRVSRQGS